MNTSSVKEKAKTTKTSPRSRFWEKMARSAVLGRLSQLQGGKLTLIEGPTTTSLGSAVDDRSTVMPTVFVHNPRFYTKLCTGGNLGAAESFMEGDWSCDDLTSLIRLFVRNLNAADRMDTYSRWLTLPISRGVHWLRKNTPQGSRKNIHAHYDLGNEFFRLFLDETMMYSSGVFEKSDYTLKQASEAKLDRICKKLRLSPSDHVIEIGTGWGGFALHAARQYGCRITTTTISEEQYALAEQRVKQAGLQNRITLLKKDYRDLSGQYDKLVSIEMIEAVGNEFLPTFFGKCGSLLKPDGQMLLQAITMCDQRYAQYLVTVDFIKRFIFPGCCVPSFTAMCNAITKSSDLRVSAVEDITPHYATTLNHWRQRFLDNEHAVDALGYDDRFKRMWEYYLCYCEAGFAERYTGDLQILLNKPSFRGDTLLAPCDSLS